MMTTPKFYPHARVKVIGNTTSLDGISFEYHKLRIGAIGTISKLQKVNGKNTYLVELEDEKEFPRTNWVYEHDLELVHKEDD